MLRDFRILISHSALQLKALKSSNQEMQKSLSRTMKAMEKLTSERSTMVIQLEQQALSVHHLKYFFFRLISFSLLYSTITSLTSRMDKLESDLEGYKSARLRHSNSRHNKDLGELTPKYNRRERPSINEAKRWSTESMASLYSEPHRGPFQWQMPFTVKCIGTFRYCDSIHPTQTLLECYAPKINKRRTTYLVIPQREREGGGKERGKGRGGAEVLKVPPFLPSPSSKVFISFLYCSIMTVTFLHL